MRLISIFLALLVSAPSQIPSDSSLKSLEFLRGLWVAESRNFDSEVTEFLWSRQSASPYVLGRAWVGNAGACPWCVTKKAMAFYYDNKSNQIRLHLHNSSGAVLDFHIVASNKGSVQFETDSTPDLSIYRLTYQLSKSGRLVETTEKGLLSATSQFSTVSQEYFLRDSGLRYP